MKFGFGAKAAGGDAMGSKLEQIKQRLQAVQGTPAVNKVGGGETIADDGVIPADKQAQIASDEALVRAVLGMVGVDYDALIAMDGKSANPSIYARAVQANPALLQDVLSADRPVLAALQVAMGYKPVADFVGKYGATPEDIKSAMRAEFEAEMVAKEAGGSKAARAAPVFSGNASSVRQAPVAAGKGKLADVFGK